MWVEFGLRILHITPLSTSRFQEKWSREGGTFLRDVNGIAFTCVPLNLEHIKVKNALMHCVCYVAEGSICSLVMFARRRPLLISCITIGKEGTRWRSWLRHCPTSRKVAGSVPVGVTGILHLHVSGRTMALGSTQSLTEMSTGDIPWG
jgi:hypothetical protein